MVSLFRIKYLQAIKMRVLEKRDKFSQPITEKDTRCSSYRTGGDTFPRDTGNDTFPDPFLETDYPTW